LLFAIPTTLSQLSAYLEVACLNNKWIISIRKLVIRLWFDSR
jgi:hypothetical protein